MGMVLVPYSAWGHVAPMLAVAGQLVRRGIPVRMIAGARYRQAIETTGAVAVVPPVDHRVRVPAGHGPADLAERGMLRWQRRAAWRSTATTMAAELRSTSTELCVIDPHIPWARGLAERHGVRAVPMWSTHARRAGQGPVLINTLPELQPNRSRFGPEAHFVGPLLSTVPLEPSTVDWTRFGDRVLVVSPGTVFTRSAEFFRGIAAAFAGSEWTVVLATAQMPVAELGSLPDNVIAHRWIPQLEVLRRAQVFVTHAGINSVHEAILAGVPMVCAPRIREQRLTAALLRDLGIGAPMASGRRLRDQVDRLSSDIVVHKVVRELRDRALAAAGAERAADVVQNALRARVAALG
ncbi:glycosyltransferase [Nocardia cyriacigeorgica]|uniref:glycosyltransferase n=1 Tax=Nocardia cyriacigeorgica TaxID=135487 RepID=UPI002458C65A|nr:nucleotide disphospho-sugar-binding domain-containing protein [Nocardia cyriacigeorgica]